MPGKTPTGLRYHGNTLWAASKFKVCVCMHACSVCVCVSALLNPFSYYYNKDDYNNDNDDDNDNKY